MGPRLDENYLAVTDEAAPEFDWWRDSLAGKVQPMHEGEPHCGFYRKRVSRGGSYVPVCILPYRERLVCFVDGHQADAADVWTYVCNHPIPRAWYEAKMQGDPWPDEDGAVAASIVLGQPPVGHNKPPADPVEILKGQIEAASANIADYEIILDDQGASKAQSVRSRLLELSGEADKKREAEKAPHLAAGKAVDARYMPLVRQAKDAADRLRAALKTFENRKLAAAVQTEHEMVPDAAPIRGAYGRGASVRKVKKAVIVDQDVAYQFYRQHPDMVALIAKLAQKTIDMNLSAPPGVEVREEVDVR